MPNYPKRHIIKFYRVEERKISTGGVPVRRTVKIYYKYSKTPAPCSGAGYNPETEGIEIRAYIRQLSAEERNSARAMQDDSSLEVVINRRAVSQDMYMEFGNGTYQVGAPDNFTFEGTELKFRAKSVVPGAYDIIEYRSFI